VIGDGSWVMGVGTACGRLEVGNGRYEVGYGRRWERSPVRFTSTHLCFHFHFHVSFFHVSYFIFQKYIRYEQCKFLQQDV
jgi:hypothetical protein